MSHLKDIAIGFALAGGVFLFVLVCAFFYFSFLHVKYTIAQYVRPASPIPAQQTPEGR